MNEVPEEPNSGKETSVGENQAQGTEAKQELLSAEKSKEGLSKGLVTSLVIAAIFYFLWENYGKLFETELRELSSIISEKLLSLHGFSIKRTGTHLATPDLKFDVVPACSGSNTLNVMVCLSVVWCSIHQKLLTSFKFLSIVLSVPIAIFANGVRVALLVAASQSIGEPIAEGPVHTAIGLFGFGLALFCFFILTEFLSLFYEEKEENLAVALWISRIIQVAFMSIFSTPFLGALIGVWKGNSYDQFDQFGYVFIILGIIGIVTAYSFSTKEKPNPKKALLLLFIGCIVLVMAILLEIVILRGFFLLFTLAAIFVAKKGMHRLFIALPAFGIFFLGFPKISVMLNFMTKQIGFGAWEYSMLLRGVLTLFFIAAFLFLLMKLEKSEEKVEGAHWWNWVVIGAFAIVLPLQVFFSTQVEGKEVEAELNFSYIQGEWIGYPVQVSKSSLDYFHGKVWHRRYRNEEKNIDVLINTSGGDRKRNHPPEYCLTGAGWKILKSQKISAQVHQQAEVEMTQMWMEKEGTEKVFRYWYSDGENKYADYISMMLEDTSRRLLGHKTDWRLVRVYGQDEKVIDEFLSVMDYSIQREGNI